nr:MULTISPECIES: lipocalin-like domain-containing protein [unclassified Lysobacter]
MEDYVKAGIVVSVIASLLVGCATAPGAKSGSLGSRLVGTWQVMELVDTDRAGKAVRPYGEHPLGYIVYDATGHLHVQVMRTPATPPFADGDQKGSDREVRGAYDGYIAYFGTYRVDEARGQVIHQVQGSLMPSYTGTDQPRPIKLIGDELIIEGDTDDGHFYRRLRRVK